MKELEKVVLDNAKAYYTTGSQELSDDVFDAVIDKIREDNPDSSVLSTGWGYKPGSEDKLKHKYCHIGSLEKVKTIENIFKKLPSDVYNVSAKLDGMSCVLYYENGLLVHAITRGDGEYGVDIGEKVQYIRGCSIVLQDVHFTGAIRGEIFMTPTAFEMYSELHPEAANPRNSTAGIINSNEITHDYEYLSLYVYTVVASSSGSDTKTQYLYNWLEKNFCFVAPHYELNTDDLSEKILSNFATEFKKKVNIDGLVITKQIVKYDTNTDLYNYEQLAFKFQDEVKITTVINIQWEMSKHQAYIPVVNIEPIELEGTTVKKVAAYNAKWIQDRKLKAGSVVAVRKSNQIIPQIIEVIK